MPILLAIALAGCVGTRPVGVVDLGATHVVVQRTGGDPPLAVRVGDAAPVPLPDLIDAAVAQAWSVSGAAVLLIEGHTPACPMASAVVVARDGAATVRRIGACNDQFAFIGNDQAVLLRVRHSRRPVAWRYAGGVLDGPLLLANGPIPHGRPGHGTVAHAAEARADPAAEALRSDPAPAKTATDDDLAAAVPLPPVSRPAGEDVVPEALGAGPLPAGAPAGRPAFGGQ